MLPKSILQIFLRMCWMGMHKTRILFDYSYSYSVFLSFLFFRPSQAGLTSPTLGQEDGRGKTYFLSMNATHEARIAPRIKPCAKYTALLISPYLLSYCVSLWTHKRTPSFRLFDCGESAYEGTGAGVDGEADHFS